MWISAIKLAVSAGSKIYANKQRTKMAMSDAQLMHASKMAAGEEAYQGKLLESRQSDWKDEFILILLSVPIVMLGWQSYGQIILYTWRKWSYSFCMFGNLPIWYQTIFVGVIASVYGLKATNLIKQK